MKRAFFRLLSILILALVAAAPLDLSGAGTAALPPPPGNITVAGGYVLVPAVTGLDFPGSITFDPDSARAWVAEVGADAAHPPEVLQIDAAGVRSILRAGQLAAGELEAPLTSVTYRRGWVWLLHRQRTFDGRLVGAVSRFMPEFPARTFQTAISDLPAQGDHPLGELVFGPDGRGYFSTGTATNSGVVGPDTLAGAAAGDVPLLYDIPPLPVRVINQPFTSFNPLRSGGAASRARTAPLAPFGTYRASAGVSRSLASASTGSPQNGFIAGAGSVYSFDPDAAAHAATLRLEAWGLRNPSGLGFDPFRSGRLNILNQGAEWRGSRPVANDYDDLFTLSAGGGVEFYGWPDYAHDPRTGYALPLSDPAFCRAGLAWLCPQPLLERAFAERLTVEPAVAAFEPAASPARFDISTSRAFGHRGDLFIAQSGPLAAGSGAAEPVGFKVVRLDGQSGRMEDFIRYAAPASLADRFEPDGFNRPVDVKFLGPLMAVVDMGAYEPALGISEPDSGKVWLVVHWRLLLNPRAARGDPPAVADWLPILAARR